LTGFLELLAGKDEAEVLEVKIVTFTVTWHPRLRTADARARGAA
jgi:hypothetical protein